MADVPEAAGLSIAALDAPGQRWAARLLMPLVTLAGGAIVWAAWGLAPWYLYACGVAVAALGLWLQVLVELSRRESLTINPDGSIQIHSPSLLTTDIRLDRQDVVRVTYQAQSLNQPRGETQFNLIGVGGYVRIELREPRVLPGARWTNYLWCLRAESDPSYVAPPLPRTETAVLDFYASPRVAETLFREMPS